MVKDYSGDEALEPFFALVKEALSGMVDGESYFDFIADDIVMEFMYAPPGTPKILVGGAEEGPKAAVMSP